MNPHGRPDRVSVSPVPQTPLDYLAVKVAKEVDADEVRCIIMLTNEKGDCTTFVKGYDKLGENARAELLGDVVVHAKALCEQAGIPPSVIIAERLLS